MTNISELVRQNMLQVQLVIAKEDLRIATEHNEWMEQTSAAEVARIFGEFGEHPPTLLDLEFFKLRVFSLEGKQNEQEKCKTSGSDHSSPTGGSGSADQERRDRKSGGEGCPSCGEARGGDTTQGD